MKSVTQEMIAKRVGVSQQAVAFALSEHAEFRAKLRPETRRRILEAARQANYVPHHGARRMARTRAQSRTTSFDQIGLVYPGTSDIELDGGCLAVMGGADRELSKSHASLTFIHIAEPGDWQKVDRLSRSRSVDGWLVYGDIDDGVVNRLKVTHLPYVLLGDHRCQQPSHAVNVDHAGVGSLAARYLASLGHRRIAFFRGKVQFLYQREIFRGFRTALRELGLDEDERLIATPASLGLDFNAWSVDLLREWLRRAEPRPTAGFLAESATSAFIGLEIRRLPWAVPQELSIIACELPSGAARTHNFTRLELPMVEVGHRGAVLLHQLALKKHVERTEVRIAPSLVEGWSTCPPHQPSGREGGGPLNRSH